MSLQLVSDDQFQDKTKTLKGLKYHGTNELKMHFFDQVGHPAVLVLYNLATSRGHLYKLTQLAI